MFLKDTLSPWSCIRICPASAEPKPGYLTYLLRAASTISALLGDFIRNGDTRVKRIKQEGGTYAYYLTKNEQNIGIDILSGETETKTTKITKTTKTKTFEERDLHKLLSSYLKNSGTYSKTIFHEQSNGKDNNQIWTHPDMVGIKFLPLDVS